MVMLSKEVQAERAKVKMIEQYNIPEDLIVPEKDPRKRVRFHLYALSDVANRTCSCQSSSAS